jgi:hypothetical protein
MLEISHNLAMPLTLAFVLVEGTMIWLAGLAMSLHLAMLPMLALEQVLLGDFMVPRLWAQELLPPICTIVATTTKNASWPTKQVFQVNAESQW